MKSVVNRVKPYNQTKLFNGNLFTALYFYKHYFNITKLNIRSAAGVQFVKEYMRDKISDNGINLIRFDIDQVFFHQVAFNEIYEKIYLDKTFKNK